jgi:RND family efflux transporter MFP subunit
MVENQVDVAAQREGVVEKIVADIGTHVRKGELLAELDNRQLRATRDAAEARVRSSQFELEHWEAEIKLRETDLARDEEMFKANLITAKQVEHSRYSVEGGKFERDRERQNLRNAQETLRSLDLDLEKGRIVAPFDGVVARRYVRAGQRVTNNDRMFWVTALGPINVKFTVPQELAGKIQKGGQVLVSPPGAPEQRHAAQITMISPVVDPSSGTLEVQAQLRQASPDLLPGMTVAIRIPKAQ